MRSTPADCSNRHPLRRSGVISGTQALVSRAVQSLTHPGPDLHHSVRKGGSRQDRREPHHRDLRRAGARRSLQRRCKWSSESPRASVEVIDLRSLSPYDWEAIRHSVEKTNRVMIVHGIVCHGAWRGDLPPASRTSCSPRSTRPLDALPRSIPGSAIIRSSNPRFCRKWRR